MATRVSYPVEVNVKAIEMRLAWDTGQSSHGETKYQKLFPAEEVDEMAPGRCTLSVAPAGRQQYAYGKGPEYESETDRLKV